MTINYFKKITIITVTKIIITLTIIIIIVINRQLNGGKKTKVVIAYYADFVWNYFRR